MRTTKLTPFAKILIFVVIAAAILIPVYLLGGFNSLFGKDAPATTTVADATSAAAKPADVSDDVTNTSVAPDSDVLELSLDEWVGWKSIIDANGGLDTQKGSIYDKLGLNVKINIINDAAQSSNALINGSLDAAGYTVNRYAFLYPKFNENSVPVQMVYITNYSNGGDGIIAKGSIKGVENLVGKKIAVPRYSEAQTLVEWLLAKSSLTDDQKAKIDKVMCNTPDDAAKMFFAGQVDAAATWQPYLGQAQSGSNHVLFSTKAASNIILDGIVFRSDYIATHEAQVLSFIKGALQASDLYDKEFTAIKDSMSIFATSTDEEIKAMTGDAQLTDCANNVKLFNGVAQTLFVDMSNIWKSLGEASDGAAVNDAFNGAYIQKLAPSFPAAQAAKPQFTESQREEAKAQDNTSALIKQTFSIQFKVNSDEFADQDQAYAALAKVAETAKILNNCLIQIEGNTDSVGDAAANQVLSEKRAKAVATFLQYQDVDPTRFIVIGNGENKPIADNNTDTGKAANRRTDVFFKVIGD